MSEQTHRSQGRTEACRPTLDCAACQEGPRPITEDAGAGAEGAGGAALTIPKREFPHLWGKRTPTYRVSFFVEGDEAGHRVSWLVL